MSAAGKLSPFLTAEWRNLIMANYPVKASVLEPFLPAHTELDKWDGEVYCSLVGFMFEDVRVRGLAIPFHTSFPEVNLRFYVRFKDASGWKRGVVFISEIVPKPAITWVANSIFREHYQTLPMRHHAGIEEDRIRVGYHWKSQNHWNKVEVIAEVQARPLEPASKAEFITEHFWGYASLDEGRSNEYEVEHPRWNIHPILEYQIDCDFASVYGPSFADFTQRQPASVFLADGSPIKVYPKRIIE